MIRIESYNPSAKLAHFKKYLVLNFDFDYYLIESDYICLQFKTEPTELIKSQIIEYYNDIKDADWLDSYKSQKIEIINNKTEELMEKGYTYRGLQFSLSDRAQTNLLALYASKDDPILSYPIKFNTIDELGTFEVFNAADIANIYYSALAKTKGYLDSGTVLKEQIRNAATIIEVDSIQDNRF